MPQPEQQPSLGGSMGERLQGGSPRRPGALLASPGTRRAALAALCLALTLLLLPHLSLLAAAGYSYVWWALAPEVHWATPDPAPGNASAAAAAAPPPVPAVLHQTWQTREVPAKWAAARQSCLDLHPDYEHRLWTDEDGLRFIEEHYPWFLPTYLSYPYAIQRVDVLRYFILHHHGGIYIDLDMGCLKKLDWMRRANFTAPMTNPVGISNDVMAAAPGAAYLEHATRRLAHWNKWLGIKYVQVMFSTGPMFLTVQYSFFRRRRDVAIIPRPVYGKYDFSGDPAFYHLHGSSWHANDAAFVFWLQRNKVAVAVQAALVLGGLAGLAAVRLILQRRVQRDSAKTFKVLKDGDAWV